MMKKYTRILALILSLMLVLSGAAFAEAAPDSTAYTMTIFDPVFYKDDEVMLDLTGGTLDLSFAATDTGLTAVFADLYAGAEYEYVTSATVQLDPTGVTGYVDGMSNVYNVDVASLAGINPFDVVAQVPLRTMLNGAGALVENIEFTPEMRMAMVQSMVMSFAGEADENGAWPIVVTEEQGASVVELLAQLIGQAGLQDELGDIREYGVAFDLDGVMTADGGVLKIEAAGNLIADGESLPYTLKYTDSLQKVNLEFVLPGEGETALGALVVDSAVELTEDGREAVVTTASVVIEDEEELVVTCLTAPAADSDGVDYLLNIVMPDEETSVDFQVSTGINGEDIGFYAVMFYTEGDDMSGIGFEYYGEYVTEEANPYHTGSFCTMVFSPMVEYVVELGIVLEAQDADSAVWSLPTEGAVNLLDMTDEQSQTAMGDLMGIAFSALPVLQQNIPGLAAMMGAE